MAQQKLLASVVTYDRIDVADDLVILLGRGPLTSTGVPHEFVALVYEFGEIGTPPALHLVSQACVPATLEQDHGSARILLLLSSSRLACFGPLPPMLEGMVHLPSDLRAIAIAMRDCTMNADARAAYLGAKAVELLCETLAAFAAKRLVPVTPDTTLSQADTLRVAMARRIIDERSAEKLTLDIIARACGLNRAKLTRGFREIYDCSVTNALGERRLDLARTMLMSTDLPVSSVGYKTGYLNNASFSRAFGRRFGVSPSRYRECGVAA